MLTYVRSKNQFLKDAPEIERHVQDAVKQKLNLSVGRSELESWRNSLGNKMFHLLNDDPAIPGDALIAIEYRPNRRNFRIDFVIAGLNNFGKEAIVVIELKQWSEIEFSELSDHVKVRYAGGPTDQIHPSYQAASYGGHLLHFNEYIYNNQVNVTTCAYLHNCQTETVIKDLRFSHLLGDSPVFIDGQKAELQKFIKSKISQGVGEAMLQQVDSSPTKPSPQLAENIGSMLEGNEEFVLLDDQKTTLETIIHSSNKAKSGKKQVLIVSGGPGTGKSVIAINGLAKLIKDRQNVEYVTPNAAPREVYGEELQKSKDGKRKFLVNVKEFLRGSTVYVGLDPDSYDTLIVDEAHRLKKKGSFKKGGAQNQIVDIIQAARASIFFIDEAQIVTWADIGKIATIEKHARALNAEVEHLTLTSQFRCGGSSDFLVWLDNALGISSGASGHHPIGDFDFKIFDDPFMLHNEIKQKNIVNNKSRLVAGYCWDWISKKDRKKFDIDIKQFNFHAKWNLTEHGGSWITKDSVNEIGCIHTCQGLEVDYVGVIVGPDLVVGNGELKTVPSARAKTDRSLHGFKADFKADPVAATERANKIIRNTYRVLMTRGMKGCYVYFTDQATADYFKNLLP